MVPWMFRRLLSINESFEVSKQFWSYLVQAGVLQSPETFIRAVPHLSFVRGEENVDFLAKRYQELRKHHLFSEMEYSEDRQVLAEWMPLVMEGRDQGEAVAATRALLGTDVNFGSLTRSMIEWLNAQEGVTVHLNHRVHGLNRGVGWTLACQCSEQGRWHQADRSTPILCFSAPAVGRCRSCRRRTSRKARVLVVFR